MQPAMACQSTGTPIALAAVRYIVIRDADIERRLGIGEQGVTPRIMARMSLAFSKGLHARRWRCMNGAAVAAMALGLARTSHADGPLGSNGQRIRTSDYAIDLVQGPVNAGSRVTALGGAYVAVAWDVDGMLQNPVAPAVRPFFSVTDFDYWLGFGLTFPGSFEDMDFFNSGTAGRTDASTSVDGFLVATPAAMLQFGAFGVGLSMELQSYNLGQYAAGEQTAKLIVAFNVAHAQMAYAFDEGALVVGMGARYLLMNVRTRAPGESRAEPMRSLGAGLELGVLWKPTRQIFSLGAAFRSEIDTDPNFTDAAVVNDDGDIVFDTSRAEFYLPTKAILPWDLNVGVSAEIGADPQNKAWVSDRILSQPEELRIRLRMLEHRDYRNRELDGAKTPEEHAEINARYDELDRRDEAEIADAREAAYWDIQRRMATDPTAHAMVAASAVITGPSANAVGLESFLSQRVNRSGQQAVVSLRLGAEVGVIPNFLRLRSGTYLEPTRFETSTARPHYTGGFDVRLGVWNVFGLWPDDYQWRLAVGVDVARDYSTVGVTIAGWYPRHHGSVKVPDFEPPSLD